MKGSDLKKYAGAGAICLFLLFVIIKMYRSGSSSFANPPGSLPSLENYVRNGGRLDILNYPCKDFFFNTSHNSYLDDFQLGGKALPKHTASCLYMGARCIELDVHRGSGIVKVAGFDSTPVVAHGNSKFTVDVANYTLDKHLEVIRDNAFKWTNDPLVLYLEIFDSQDEAYMRSIGESIRRYLGNMLYEYTMSDFMSSGDKGRYFPGAPIGNLRSKIAIVINYFNMNNGNGLNYRNKYLFPVIHATTDEPENGWFGNGALISGQGEKDGFKDKWDIMARVYPDNVISSANFDKTDYEDWARNGYSFISINFGKGDYNVNKNKSFFKNSNILPKNFTPDENGRLNQVEKFDGRRWYKNTVFNGLNGGSPWINQEFAYSDNCKWKIGKWTLSMQGDGNLVLYENNSAKWSSKTSGNPGSVLVPQWNGNLVIYNPSRNIIWQSKTYGNPNNSGVKLASDGRVFLMEKDKVNSIKKLFGP